MVYPPSPLKSRCSTILNFKNGLCILPPEPEQPHLARPYTTLSCSTHMPVNATAHCKPLIRDTLGPNASFTWEKGKLIAASLITNDSLVAPTARNPAADLYSPCEACVFYESREKQSLLTSASNRNSYSVLPTSLYEYYITCCCVVCVCCST